MGNTTRQGLFTIYILHYIFLGLNPRMEPGVSIVYCVG